MFRQTNIYIYIHIYIYICMYLRTQAFTEFKHKTEVS